MEKAYVVYSSDFFGVSSHSMTVAHAGMQYSIRISPDSLIGTSFHSQYAELVADLHEKDERGLPKRAPFKTIEALQHLLWRVCRSVSESYTKTKSSGPETLQSYIQPPTVHIALAKDDHCEGGVVAKVIGDFSSDYPWKTSRLAQIDTEITNTYAWDIAPIPKDDLNLCSNVPIIQANELLVTGNAIRPGPMRQVQTTDQTQFFFKPRLDLMSPEFNREISVLDTIRSHGLDRTLKISPFKGLVLLDNGLVVGMLFQWLQGSPLAEHGELSNPNFQKLWREQVEAIVGELHRHEIVWGDVNVHNVFIDSNDDAWVIDFGGNCNIQFVDEELKETFEGDRQGLRRIFEEWLPARSKS